MSEDVLKEKFTATVDAGTVHPDNIDGVREAIEAVLLSGLGIIKARGFSAAKLTLSFKCTSKG